AGAGVDDLPVRLARVTLGTGAAVDGDGFHAAVLEDAADLDGVDGPVVPADADLGGHGDPVADGIPHPGGHGGKGRAVLQQRGAAVLGDDLVDRAAEVDVDEIGAFPVDDLAGGFAHPLAVAAEELDAHG